MARHYKKGRVSRKGLSPYQIYLNKRAKLEAEGYALREVTDEQTFMQRYNYARERGDTNFMRDYPKYDRYVNKQNYYDVRRTIRDLDMEDANQVFIYKKYKSLSYDEFKQWTNIEWTNYRDALLEIGYSYEDFRGIYE